MAAGLGAVAAIGVIGAIAAANARPRQHRQTYYDPGYGHGYGHGYGQGYSQGYGYHQPVAVRQVCRIRNEELFNRDGAYRGVFQVRVCN